jgi:hypothetical protein
MIGGPIVYFALGALLPRWSWWAEQVALSSANADLMAMVQALLAMTLTTILWIAATLVTRPESEATLRAFYLRARPPGWWGPVSRGLVAEGAVPAPPRGLLGGGLMTAAVAAVGLSLPVLCLGQLMVARYEQAAGLAAAAIVAGLALRRLVPWHLDRMDAHFLPVSEHTR